jgi:hypothetical protein
MREETIREVEQFLYREARLLDERRFHEWLELFTDDVHYRMTGRRNRYPKSSKAIAILDLGRYVEEDSADAAELAILDENSTRSARASRGWIPAWPGRRTLHRAPAICLPISRSSEATQDPNSRSAATSSSTGADPRPSRISTSAQDGMSCGGLTARGRSPAAN